MSPGHVNALRVCSVQTSKSSDTGPVVGWEKGRVEAEAAGTESPMPKTSPQRRARPMVDEEVVITLLIPDERAVTSGSMVEADRTGDWTVC